MEIDVTEGDETGVPAPTVSLEISSEIAERAEELLSNFAEDAGLETALIVDRGGALVAGISSEEDVTVDVISGLVAGASSAMRALVDQLGETGEIESMHQGGKRLLYLREIVNRFVLVGVSDASFPPGIVREKASQLQPNFSELLRDVKPLDPPTPIPAEKPKSLRAVAAERAAARVKVEVLHKGALSEDPAEAEGPETEEEGDTFEAEEDPVPAVEGESEEVAENQETPSPDDTEEEDVDESPASEPVEVLEPIDTGETEIVIEKSSASEDAIGESPFELENDEEPAENEKGETQPAAEATESVFELEEVEPEEDEQSEPTREASVFEWVDEEESIEEATEPEEDGETPETVFEFDGAEDDEGEDEEVEEDTPDSSLDDSEENSESELEEDESESQNSGPLYF